MPNACLDAQGVYEGDVHPQKLENFVFIKLMVQFCEYFWVKI